MNTATRDGSSHRARIRTRTATDLPRRTAHDADDDDTIDVEAKPLSPAAAAVGLGTQGKHAWRRPLWALTTVAAAALAGAAGFWLSRPSHNIDPAALVSQQLSLADSALRAGRLLNPRDGAAHHYQTVLAIDPQNPRALRGLDAVARALSKHTQAHMAQRRLADAAVSLARLRELQPEYAELPLLDAQLEALQDALVATHTLHETQTTAVAESGIEADREPAVPQSAARASPVAPRAAETRPAATAETAPAPQPPAHVRETQTPAPAPEAVASLATMTPTIVPPDAITIAALPAIDSSSVAPADASIAADPPRLVTYVPPRYPADARARQLEGWVQVSLEIAPSGEVIEPRVEAGERRYLFERAALAAVRQWKYVPDPNRLAGDRWTVRVAFRLQ